MFIKYIDLLHSLWMASVENLSFRDYGYHFVFFPVHQATSFP